MRDRIVVENLELSAFIGVPQTERTSPQRLTANLVLEPIRGFSTLGDKIENAVDYAVVCDVVKALALARPRHLIETLAEEIAAALLARFALDSVEVELRKYVLADTAFVAAKIRRTREIQALQNA